MVHGPLVENTPQGIKGHQRKYIIMAKFDMIRFLE